MVAVNPEEGQVAIAWSKAPDGSTIVGRISNRAWRWIEEATGKTAPEIWSLCFTITIGRATLPSTLVTNIIWAAIENERRSSRPGPELTLDDADHLVDEIGLETATQRAVLLVLLSFRDRLEKISAKAVANKEDDPVPPLLAAAKVPVVSTGTNAEPLPSPPVSPLVSSGA